MIRVTNIDSSMHLSLPLPPCIPMRMECLLANIESTERGFPFESSSSQIFRNMGRVNGVVAPEQQELNSRSLFKFLSLHAAMFLALTCTSWSADFSKLDLRRFRNTPKGVVFHSTNLAKQSIDQEKRLQVCLFFVGNENLCLSGALYVQAT